MLGIIGAMDQEVAAIKAHMTDVRITTKASMDYYVGSLDGKKAVVVRSGIGKVNAAVCAQILVDEFNVSAIVNTGVAGSLRAEIDIGDIVLSVDALQHDMDVTLLGYKPGQIPGMELLAFPADQALIELAETCSRRVNPDIKTFTGRVVSGDQFVSDSGKKEWLIQNFDGYCTEMEGAAIAQTAYLNRIPYLVIRAISDKADNSASMDYPEFEARAIERSVRLMEEMIRCYQNKQEMAEH